MNPLIQQSPSHWYRWNGKAFEPFYEVQAANGSGLRRVTLADARKVDAVPSATNVIAVLAKPQLEVWKQTQLIEACLTLPTLPGELLDDYARRAVTDAEAKMEKARQFGTDLHRAIELELSTGLKGHWGSDDETLEAFMVPVREWLKENVTYVYASEFVVGSQAAGVAGKLDLDCDLKRVGRAIVDFKTQTIKNGKPTYYSEWPIQLATYEHCRNLALGGMPEMNLVSVVIDSVVPGGIHVKTWDDAEIYWELFEHTYELWSYLKGYDPRKEQ